MVVSAVVGNGAYATAKPTVKANTAMNASAACAAVILSPLAVERHVVVGAAARAARAKGYFATACVPDVIVFVFFAAFAASLAPIIR